MKRAILIVLVGTLLVTAGCNGLLDGGNSTDATPRETITQVPTATATPDQTPTPMVLEQEYMASGREFTIVMAERMHAIHGMYLVDRKVYRNNTVSITYRLNEGTPLFKSMMNATQAAAVTLTARTTTDEDIAMRNGREGKIHRPEMINVNIVDPQGNHIGNFQINPEAATDYRLYRLDPDNFAQNVVNTLELERQVERGSHSPGWYLNRSQLYDWVRLYLRTLSQETDPSETVYEKEFQLREVDLNPENMTIHLELEWDRVEMGQSVLGGQTDINAVYYETANASWAMAPKRISYYFDRPDRDDWRGHMDIEAVAWILDEPKTTRNLNEYFNMAEGELVDDE